MAVSPQAYSAMLAMRQERADALCLAIRALEHTGNLVFYIRVKFQANNNAGVCSMHEGYVALRSLYFVPTVHHAGIYVEGV